MDEPCRASSDAPEQRDGCASVNGERRWLTFADRIALAGHRVEADDYLDVPGWLTEGLVPCGGPGASYAVRTAEQQCRGEQFWTGRVRPQAVRRAERARRRVARSGAITGRSARLRAAGPRVRMARPRERRCASRTGTRRSTSASRDGPSDLADGDPEPAPPLGATAPAAVKGHREGVVRSPAASAEGSP